MFLIAALSIKMLWSLVSGGGEIWQKITFKNKWALFTWETEQGNDILVNFEDSTQQTRTGVDRPLLHRWQDGLYLPVILIAIFPSLQVGNFIVRPAEWFNLRIKVVARFYNFALYRLMEGERVFPFMFSDLLRNTWGFYSLVTVWMKRHVLVPKSIVMQAGWKSTLRNIEGSCLQLECGLELTNQELPSAEHLLNHGGPHGHQ